MSEHDRPKNEGEGSRSADRHYREKVTEHARRADVEGQAEKARKDVEASPEEYRRAEEEGKRRSAGDLPSDLEG